MKSYKTQTSIKIRPKTRWDIRALVYQDPDKDFSLGCGKISSISKRHIFWLIGVVFEGKQRHVSHSRKLSAVTLGKKNICCAFPTVRCEREMVHINSCVLFIVELSSCEKCHSNWISNIGSLEIQPYIYRVFN